MNKLLLSACLGLLGSQLAIGQVVNAQTSTNPKPTTIQTTTQQSTTPLERQSVVGRNVTSEQRPVAVASRASTDMLLAPFQQSTKLGSVSSSPQVSASTASHAPGQGDANQFRARLSRFLVADEVPADFPQWDIATQTKQEYRATVSVWMVAHKSQVKPEYHSHRLFSGE